MTSRRKWDGIEWQTFALKLVQLRHGAENVQIVPDTVQGDAGIEFFTTNGCVYQCYAPEEVSDVKKAASAMKVNAARDLKKLQSYEGKIGELLCGVRIERWILLCPFLDDKNVIAEVRKRGAALKGVLGDIISPKFQALVHSQENFAGELEQLRQLSIGIPLVISSPSDEAIFCADEDDLSKVLAEKLKRAFAGILPKEEIKKKRLAYIKAHLRRENALAQLKLEHPSLWDQSLQCLDAEEQRLAAVGATEAMPASQLQASVERLERSLKDELPSLPSSALTHIAIGTVAEWLMRCPLDFPSGEE